LALKEGRSRVKGFLLSESLEDPLFLNRFATEYVRVRRRNDEEVATGYPRFWHLFKIVVVDDQTERVAQETASLLTKPGWYAHHWNGEIVYVCFSDRVMQMPQEERGLWSSPQSIEVREYALYSGMTSTIWTSSLNREGPTIDGAFAQ
jgi:hypothetical protein